MKGIVDRFEENWVVIEIDGRTEDVKRSLVASEVRPGDVVELVNGQWVPNKSETEERSKHIKKLMDELWND